MIKLFNNTTSIPCRHLCICMYYLLILVSLAGCATQQPLIPITDSDERIYFRGFSVLPPSGSKWNWVGTEDQNKSGFFNATFFKGKRHQTYIARVELLNAKNENFDDFADVREWAYSSKFFSAEFEHDE